VLGSLFAQLLPLDSDFGTDNILSTDFFINCESLKKARHLDQVKTWEIKKVWVIFSANAQVKCNQQHHADLLLLSLPLFCQVWRWSLFMKTSPLCFFWLHTDFTVSVFNLFPMVYNNSFEEVFESDRYLMILEFPDFWNYMNFRSFSRL